MSECYVHSYHVITMLLPCYYYISPFINYKNSNFTWTTEKKKLSYKKKTFNIHEKLYLNIQFIEYTVSLYDIYKNRIWE